MNTTDYTKYVNPNIGTVGHLLQATYPNVQSPHGAAVVAPLYRPGMKDRYNSDKIFGFTVGTAVVMPTVTEEDPNLDNTAATFDHDLEEAHPYSYSVWLESADIESRHTASKNYGRFEFTFPAGKPARVAFYMLDCGEARYENGHLYMKPAGGPFGPLWTMFDLSAATKVTRLADIPTTEDHPYYDDDPLSIVVADFADSSVAIPFCLSALGMESCDESYAADCADKDFETIAAESKAAWNEVLGKVRVTGGTEAEKRVFYTAIYRATSRMHNYSVGGKYFGFDGKIHDDGGEAYLCDDGIWDTYRAMYPLQLLLEPETHKNALRSYLRMYEESGWLPRFPHLYGNIPCMLGHHSVSILAEAIAKGVDIDPVLSYEAAYKNATKRTMLPWVDGEAEDLTQCYYDNGFFPALEEDEPETCTRIHRSENRQAVAVTIEHSYDDWCVAELAKKLGKTEDEAYFRARSKNYKNVYDAEIGFVHPRKADGTFTKVYNPKYCGGNGGRKYFAENNAYIYNFAAHHDPYGMVEMMGGEEAFAAKLDNLFVEQYDGLKSEFFTQYPDATGLVGQFCMGNEPSFHIPYLYNFCGQAYKTQRKIHELIHLWFTDSPLGICGDEDGGAMSAFLVFSAMGFYPFNPASAEYELGSPIFDKVELTLPNGKTFAIVAEGASGKAKYIQSATMNGKALTAPRFTHADLMEGGELVLEMGERPNKTLFA